MTNKEHTYMYGDVFEDEPVEADLSEEYFRLDVLRTVLDKQMITDYRAAVRDMNYLLDKLL